MFEISKVYTFRLQRYVDYKNLICSKASIPFLKIIIQAAMGWNDRWILRVHYWSTHVYGSSQAPQDPGV